MFTDHLNQTDHSLDAYVLGIPADMKLPPAVKSLVKAYDTAFTDYDNAVIAAELSRLTMAEAAAKDKSALIASLDNGSNDPGPTHVTTALRSAVVADEKVRHTAAKLNNAATTLETAIRDHAGEALTLVLDHDRELTAAVSAKWQKIAELTDEVNALNRAIGVHSNFVLHLTGHHERIEPVSHEDTLPPARHRNNDQALAAIDRLRAERPDGAQV
jgi:hypothetical protein